MKTPERTPDRNGFVSKIPRLNSNSKYNSKPKQDFTSAPSSNVTSVQQSTHNQST